MSILEIVGKYFNAWEIANINPDLAKNILNEIFAADAVYRVKLGIEEYFGINDIIKYWLTNPGSQTKAHPKIIEGFGNEDMNKYFCEFENSFITTINNSPSIKITQGMILFKFNHSENKLKINEIREFYSSDTYKLLVPL